jgi:vacuolar-type H+-ATPase subunit C/Vma6
MPGVLDVFAARQDRRSLRALLRGAGEGAPPRVRLDGLLPTPSLPELALTELANQPSPAGVVRRLMQLGHPDSSRLLPLVQASQVDLLAVDVALLTGLAERATQAAIAVDETTRDFVRAAIDVGNAQNALLFAGGPRDGGPANVFVHGGRWLSGKDFAAVAAAGSRERALTLLAAALATSPLASSLPAVPADLVRFDRAFLTETLKQLTRAARRDPLSMAPLLRVLLLIEAQSCDLRTLAWGAVFGTPPLLRKQQLMTPA